MKALLAVVVLVGAVLAACGGGTSDSSDTATPTKAPATTVAPTPAPPGLTELDPTSALVVKGRDRLRVCVETLDEGVPNADAVQNMQQALDVAALDKRWPKAFGTPLADAGCPLPPVALQNEKGVCRPEVGPYMVYAFVAEQSLFTERFPENVFRLSGMRKADEELLAGGSGAACAYGVAEAWFLTPEDLNNPELLQKYIFDIFTIADIPDISSIAETCC